MANPHLLKNISGSLDKNSGPPSLLTSSGTLNVAKYFRRDLMRPDEPAFDELGLTLMTSGYLLNLSTVIK